MIQEKLRVLLIPIIVMTQSNSHSSLSGRPVFSNRGGKKERTLDTSYSEPQHSPQSQLHSGAREGSSAPLDIRIIRSGLFLASYKPPCFSRGYLTLKNPVASCYDMDDPTCATHGILPGVRLHGSILTFFQSPLNCAHFHRLTHI